MRLLSLTLIGISLLMSGCGDLEMVLPSSGSYKVNAYVNDSTTLDSYAIVSQKDEIYPFFANSVINDPDVMGLSVFLQTPAGETAGEKTHYILKNAVLEDKKLEKRVNVTRLDRELPLFSLPETLEIGPYSMIFQVLGVKGVLYQIEKPIFYLKDASFSIGDIRSYLPGASSDSHLVPPGITLMMEAVIGADERLDPYVVWYSGKKRIGEGRVFGEKAQILWKAPEQTGFHTIRAEAFPFKPEENLSGQRREISLAVSSKVENRAYFQESDRTLLWYQFWGNLWDSKAPVMTEKALVPMGGGIPRWHSAGTVYGLSVGPEDIYFLPNSIFTSPEASSRGEQKSGRFLFRMETLGEGTIFHALFKGLNPADEVYMDLSYNGESYGLSLKTRERGLEARLNAELRTGDADTLILDFSSGDTVFSAQLSFEDNRTPPTEPLFLAAGGPISGEGVFQFGRGLEENADPGQERIPGHVTAVIDEFVVLRGSPLAETIAEF